MAAIEISQPPIFQLRTFTDHFFLFCLVVVACPFSVTDNRLESYHFEISLFRISEKHSYQFDDKQIIFCRQFDSSVVVFDSRTQRLTTWIQKDHGKLSSKIKVPATKFSNPRILVINPRFSRIYGRNFKFFQEVWLHSTKLVKFELLHSTVVVI